MGTVRLLNYPFQTDMGTVNAEYLPRPGEVVTLDGASFRVENIEWRPERGQLTPTLWLSEQQTEPA